eukprot:sb/3464118/
MFSIHNPALDHTSVKLVRIFLICYTLQLFDYLLLFVEIPGTNNIIFVLFKKTKFLPVCRLAPFPFQTFINYNVKLFIEAWPLGAEMTTMEEKGDSPMINDDSVERWAFNLSMIFSPACRKEMEANPNPRDYDIDYAKVQRYSESEIDDHGRMLRNAFKNCSSEEVINLSCRTFVSSIRVVNRYLNAQHVMNCKVRETELRMQKCKEELDKHRISVIDLQNKIIALQDRHLESASNSVAKMKAYSTVLSQNLSVITPKVVKNAVAESDRAKNLVVFGLPESTNRVDSISVKELFEELNEMPVTKSMKQFGLKLDSSSKPRPLVISLENRESLLALLRKAKLLKQSDNFSSVFFSPDLTPVQQKERKLLVETIKRLRKEDPNGKYYIHNGITKMALAINTDTVIYTRKWDMKFKFASPIVLTYATRPSDKGGVENARARDLQRMSTNSLMSFKSCPHRLHVRVAPGCCRKTGTQKPRERKWEKFFKIWGVKVKNYT